MINANEACYGKKAIPSYQFNNAKVIVSLGADFLGTWLSPVEFASQYAAKRQIKGEKPEMNRHIHFESMLSLTGSNADDRIVHLPSQTGAVALAILNALSGAASGFADKSLNEGVKLAADQLKASNGEALVVCGSNDVNIQVIINAINAAIGANGKTINWASTSNYRKGSDADFTKLAADINAGTIGALLVYGANPVYNYNDGKKLGEAIAKLPLSISFSSTLDETAEYCKYILPNHHWLESWGDAEPKSGYISLLQPAINPMFKTRYFQTSLLKWAANPVNYETYFKSYWTAKLAGNFEKAFQDGVVEPTASSAAGAVFSAAKVEEAKAKIGASKPGAYEVVFYQKVSVGDGNQANNPWLQELPDPITKVTWDNYAVMSPALAKEILSIDVMGTNQRDSDKYEVTPEKPTIKITVNGKSLELPVLIVPGNHNKVIAVALGYGRQSAEEANTAENIGRSANGAGKNAYPLVGFDGSNFIYNAETRVEKTGNTYPLAQTQVHGFTEGRPVLHETSLAAFVKNPEEVLKEVNDEREALTLAAGPNNRKEFVKDATIYPDYEKPGIKWGMSIDLSTCTGCSACVVACTAENNVSVVGKMQVQRAHEMHWLRIDRYFTGSIENPDVVFQPMLCQHCDNAPCENVCPVAATNHSSEGLNQMTYNRCIGTRYCANNCPFKVRRFNWLDYTGADSFPDNQRPIVGIDLNESVMQMNDDLTRMVLNPDVTVRSRGVIEKCSFCVQRLQETKLNAKKEQNPDLVRNVKTACMQACPTHAISFGNVNDKESDVYKIRHVEQKHRNFYVLEQLHVLPNVSYLAKIRNTDRNIGMEEEKTAEGTKKEMKEHA
jgi:molybdopterin-containing oxidoreductase family iron-sulfur binding subunit